MHIKGIQTNLTALNHQPVQPLLQHCQEVLDVKLHGPPGGYGSGRGQSGVTVGVVQQATRGKDAGAGAPGDCGCG